MVRPFCSNSVNVEIYSCISWEDEYNWREEEEDIILGVMALEEEASDINFML